MPAFSVRSKAWVVAEALGGFGLECFGFGPWLLPGSHINPGAVSWRIRFGSHKMVGVGRLETGKVQATWFPVLFLYLSGLVRSLISITRRSRSFVSLTGTSAATLLRPLSTALGLHSSCVALGDALGLERLSRRSC